MSLVGNTVVRQPLPSFGAAIAQHRGSSTVDPRIVEIERSRRDRNLSQALLLRRAMLSRRSWVCLLAGAKPKDATLKRLRDALDGKAYTPPAAAVLSQLYRLTAALLAPGCGVAADVAAVSLQDFSVEKPNSPGWLAIARLRQTAIYVLTVELQIPNAELGRAIGCTRQNVKKARGAVEDRRDTDAALDELIRRVAALAGQVA